MHARGQDRGLHLRDRPIGWRGARDGSLKPEANAEDDHVVDLWHVATGTENDAGGCPRERNDLRHGCIDTELDRGQSGHVVELFSEMALNVAGETGPPVHERKASRGIRGRLGGPVVTVRMEITTAVLLQLQNLRKPLVDVDRAQP